MLDVLEVYKMNGILWNGVKTFYRDDTCVTVQQVVVRFRKEDGARKMHNFTFAIQSDDVVREINAGDNNTGVEINVNRSWVQLSLQVTVLIAEDENNL